MFGSPRARIPNACRDSCDLGQSVMLASIARADLKVTIKIFPVHNLLENR